MPILYYRPELEQPNPRKAFVTFDKITLEPGVNVLSEVDVKKLQAHPDFARYCQWGAIALEAEPLPLLELTPPSPEFNSPPEVKRARRKPLGQNNISAS